MNKLLKITLGIGVLVLAGAAVLRIIREEKKKFEKEEKEIDKGLDNLGLNKEKAEEEFKNKSDERNFVKALYHTIEFGSLDGEVWDRDLIRIHSEIGKNGKSKGNGALDNENVIHVMQSDAPKGGEILEFYFEIPSSTYMENAQQRYPRIGDYIKAFKLAATHMSDSIIKFTPKPIWELIGYYVISYKIRGREIIGENGEKVPEEFQTQIKIPKKDYESFADINEKHDGLFDYIKSMYKRISGGKKQNPIQVEIINPDLKPWEEIYDLKIVAPVLMFKISFQIAREGGPNSLGINLKTATKCLRYLTEDLVISRNRDTTKRFLEKNINIEIRYNHVMFHSKDYKYPEAGFDLLRYYTVDINDPEDPKFSSRKIISESYDFVFDD